MTRKRLLSIFVTFAWGSVALAQGVFVKPAPTPKTPPTPCTADPRCAGLPAVSYDFPIKAYVGRYVDSSYTGDWQVPFRTARAGAIKFAADLNPARVYIRVGSAIGAYNLSTFFSQKLQQAMMPASMVPDLGFSGARGLGDAQDSFAPFDKFVYPECKNSGWEIHNVDGQDRLYGFDWDDRGYVYAAYHTFGWGIVRDDGKSDGNQMPFVFQDGSQVAEAIVSLKSGNDYFVLISFNASPTLLYRVNNPQHPELIRAIDGQVLNVGSDLGGQTSARNSTRDVLAVTNLYGHSISFFSTASLTTSNTPLNTINGNFTVTGSDGTNFYAGESTGQGLTGLSMFSPAGQGGYEQTHFNISSANFLPTSLHADSGLLVIGSSRAQDVMMFKVVNRNLTPIPSPLIGPGSGIPGSSYLPSFYSGSPTGNAHPLRGNLWDAAMYKQNGKSYLLVSFNSLGDVYEIQAGDALLPSLQRVGNTPNPRPAPTARSGAFPGDTLTFGTTVTSGFPMVTWDFGNPEASAQTADGVANTTAPVSVAQAVTHQFSGITNLPTTRSVKVTTTDGSADPGQIDVPILKPQPAVRAANTGVLFTPDTTASNVQILAGDQFEDASEGAVEGHVASWTISQTGDGALNFFEATPGAGHTAVSGPSEWGLCGPRALTFYALYGPHDASSNPLNGYYNASLPRVTYNVVPFALDPVRASGSGTQVTFASSARLADTSKVLKSTASKWTVTWLKDGSAQQTTSESIGTVPSWTVNNITNGSVVSVFVSIPAADVVAGCDVLSTSTSAPLAVVAPTPVLSGSCETPAACSVADITNGDLTDSSWSYKWYVDGAQVAGSGKTLSLVGQTVGAHSIILSVTNTFGAASASTTVTVKTPACAGMPNASTVTLGYTGAQSHCYAGSASGCTSGEAITFTVGSYGYAFSPCDKYDWDFGDGSQHSTQGSPVTHTYAGTGPYNVTLKLDGGLAVATLTTSVTYGASAPPPPPPGMCSAPNSNAVTLSYYGSTSHCYGGVACSANETISFSAGTYGYTLNPSCDRYDWNFGDGTAHSSLTAPTHSYSVAAPYTVTLNLNGTNFTTGVSFGSSGPPPPTGCNGTPNESNVTLSYNGTSGHCSFGSACNAGEPITFTLGTYGYTFLTCDTFDWQFGDGTVDNTRNPTHVFPSSGSLYVVQVKITSGSNSVTLHTTVSFGGSPANNETVDFAYPGPTVATGSVISFTVLPAANTKAVRWAWTFGDGNEIKSNSRTVTNTYMTSGTFTVTVIALDAAGNNIAQKSHAITATKPSRHRGAHSGT